MIIGLGNMLGKMLAESGGADRIASTLVAALGERRVHWAMMLIACIVGVPVFFQVGFVLLIPLDVSAGEADEDAGAVHRGAAAGRPVGDARPGATPSRPDGRDRSPQSECR